MRACSGTQNRICSSCRTCSSSQYEYKKCSRTQNRVCYDCRTCNSNQYQTRACSSTQNRMCSDCTTCTSNQYETRACAGTQNRICSSCRTCSSSQYEYKKCSGFQNRVCNDCQICKSNEWEVRSCSRTHISICASCRNCTDREYETGSCSSTQNRICSKCTTCHKNEYEARKCHGTKDRLCLPCTTCKSNEFEVNKCSEASNRVCALCKTCASNQYVSTRCCKTQDTVCADCTSPCTSNEYESTKCSAKHDRVCSKCSTCNSSEFLAKPCMDATNTVCLPCSTCRTDEFIVEKCSETKDTVCLKWTVIFEKKHLHNLILAAFEIVFSMRDSIVDFVKAFWKIYMALMKFDPPSEQIIMDVGGITPMGMAPTKPDPSSEQIILDVGGRRFSTSLPTLRSIRGTFFERMFCEGANPNISENGTYLIDRDPSAFEYILDYLRIGDLFVESDDVNVRMQVLDDAKYFKLPNNLQDYLRWFSVAGINLWFSEYAFLNEQLRSLSMEIGELLFQASKDGDAVSTFHSHCDNQGPSVVIVESLSGYLFGGYTHANWSSNAGYSTSTGAFLFRLRPYKKRYDQRETSKAYAIHCHSNHGPVFGNGHTLFINNCMGAATCYVKNTGYNIPANYELNGGEQYFRIKDYAVVQAKALQLF